MYSLRFKSIEPNPDLEYSNSNSIGAIGQMYLAELVNGKQCGGSTPMFFAISRSKQLELAIPQSKISSLSSGEFVGKIADNPNEKIELKTFCAEIQNDHQALAQEQANYRGLPQVSSVTQKEMLENYLAIKKEVQIIIQTEMERMLDTPELTDLIIKKET